MNSFLKIFISALILCISVPSLFSQDKDFNLWTGITIEKNLNKRLDLGLEFQNRFRNNATMREESLADLSLSYSKKSFSAGLIYRITNIKDEPNNKTGNRFSFQSSYEFDILRFNLSARAKYQKHYVSIFNSEDGFIPENYLRTRFKLDYNIKGIPLKPYINYESFLRIRNSQSAVIDKDRYTIGANYKVNKDHSVGLYYHFTREINVSKPEYRYILGIDYKIKI